MYEYWLFSFLAAFIICFALSPLVARLLKKKGIVGVDIHKKEKPEVPEMVGFSMIIGLICTLTFLIFILPEKMFVFISFILTIFKM